MLHNSLKKRLNATCFYQTIKKIRNFDSHFPMKIFRKKIQMNNSNDF